MMDLLQAIKTRRTIHDFTAEPVTREQVEAMLEAATWAPNHKLTNPWEFYVVSGDAKDRLARLRGELKRSKHADPASPQAQAVYDRAYRELATVPWAILVCQKLSEDAARADEDHLAVGAAIQNLLLAAHAMGIGTFWGTGALINHPVTFQELGVPEGRKAIGLIFVGHAAHEVKVPPREPLSDHVRWVQ